MTVFDFVNTNSFWEGPCRIIPNALTSLSNGAVTTQTCAKQIKHQHPDRVTCLRRWIPTEQILFSVFPEIMYVFCFFNNFWYILLNKFMYFKTGPYWMDSLFPLFPSLAVCPFLLDQYFWLCIKWMSLITICLLLIIYTFSRISSKSFLYHIEQVPQVCNHKHTSHKQVSLSYLDNKLLAGLHILLTKIYV